MTETTKRSLLDELRAKADAVRARDALDRLPAAEARQEINACLWRTFRWLEEALGHLEVIRPPIARTFRISNLLSLEGPRFESGFASFRRSGLSTQDELEHVQIFYQLAGREPIVLRVHPSAVIGVDERLRGATLPYRYQTELDQEDRVRFGIFEVEPKISASVLFQPDYGRRTIGVTLSNVDRFETVRLEFRPATIDIPALEDLVRLMLGEGNGFLHRAPLALINARTEEPSAGAQKPQVG